MDIVSAELAAAKAKFPTWPADPFHALAILGEEFGELTKAVTEATYEPWKSDLADVRREAIQTAAMAIRFLEGMGGYTFKPDASHVVRKPDSEPTLPLG
jgi:NTP pyrophosphatase (non-canonical NTP hydrolase)